MSAANDCSCNCPTPVISEIPGTAGGSSFSVVTEQFTIPANNTQTTVQVNYTGWMIPGVIVVTEGPAHFEIFSIGTTDVVLIFRAQTGDAAPGVIVSANSLLSPSAVQGQQVADPLPVANGGTGGANLPAAQANLGATPWSVSYGGTGASTKSTAQLALGLGQDSTISTVTALAQAITASATQIAGSDLVIPAAGTYLVTGSVSIDYAGATFAASRVITITVRNTTQSVDIITVTRNTGILSAATFPTQDIKFPETVYSGGAVNDHIQVRISVAVINSAGSFTVLASTCCITPLRRS